MKFSVVREDLLKPLQSLIGVVERRQTLAVLSNVLLIAEGEQLSLTTSDLEVEISAKIPVEIEANGEITVPARKFFDICKALPQGIVIHLHLDGDRVRIRAGKSRFTLSTLPATEFPIIEEIKQINQFMLDCAQLKRLIDRTQFCMAQQDVRYFLNGLMLELQDDQLRAVATDGHRLAMSELRGGLTGVSESSQVIVPRKGIQELNKILGDGEGNLRVQIGENHILLSVGQVRFVSKLIDGKFPDYRKVLPEPTEQKITADRIILKDALIRTSILSNEKFRGVRFIVDSDLMRIQAHNPEKEEAEEELEVEFKGQPVEIGFNVSYMVDALNTISGDKVDIYLKDGNSSCLIQDVADDSCKYVVMPMRL